MSFLSDGSDGGIQRLGVAIVSEDSICRAVWIRQKVICPWEEHLNGDVVVLVFLRVLARDLLWVLESSQGARSANVRRYGLGRMCMAMEMV